MNRRGTIAIILGVLTLAAIGVGVFGALRARPETRSPKPEPSRTATATPSRSSATPVKSTRLPIVDVHVHLSLHGYDRLFGLMKRYGFDHVVNLSGGHPRGGLPEQLAMARATGGRVTNFTTLAYEQAEYPGYGEKMATLLREAHRLGAKGLKIAKVLGLNLKGPDGRLIPVDDPGLDPVFETAGELGMPVAIHSGDPKAFWLPVTPKNERFAELSAHPGWALYGKKVPSFDRILDQLERRIARHPKTTFISVHLGNCAEDIDRVASMLRKHANMYVDTAARIPEFGRHPPDKLRAFFIEFQDRILFGSDLGVGPEPSPLFLGSEGPEPATDAERELFFSATHRFFETEDRNFDHPTPIQGNWKINGIHLPREVLEKIYAKNAIRVLRLPESLAAGP